MKLSKNTFLSMVPHNEGRFLFLLIEDGKAQFRFATCVSLFLVSNLLACISIFSVLNFWHVLIFFVFSFYIFRVHIESPICVLNADMFATPSTMFELPLYATDLAHLLAEAPYPPPSRTCPFNKLVLDFLDIVAEQGEDSDRHGTPSC